MTPQPTRGAPLGATAKTVLECIKANPGQSTHRVFELLQATANPCLSWEVAQKTLHNLRQQGHIENRTPVAPRGAARLPAEWHATGKAEFVRPSPEQLAAAKAQAKARLAPRNKTTDGERILVLLQDHGSLSTSQIGQHLGLTTDKAYRRLRRLVDGGKVLSSRKTTKTASGAELVTVHYTLPGASDGARQRWANERPEGQTGDKMNTSQVIPLPTWNNPRPEGEQAFLLPSRVGDRLLPHVSPKSMCVGRGEMLLYAPSRLQR